jgi:hypothetical protein
MSNTLTAVKLIGNYDVLELQSHLSLNGYHFHINSKGTTILIFSEELDYLETILRDRNIDYEII